MGIDGAVSRPNSSKCVFVRVEISQKFSKTWIGVILDSTWVCSAAEQEAAIISIEEGGEAGKRSTEGQQRGLVATNRLNSKSYPAEHSWLICCSVWSQAIKRLRVHILSGV